MNAGPSKKLGVLISSAPPQPNFRHGLRLAEAALARGVAVYLYLIDDAVPGIDDAGLQSLRQRGLHLFACAFGAKKRNLVTDDRATWVGLATASDLIAATDRFVSFN
jgi:sulfur relay (sulfurtransferase) complex TusBCD TusD component (DsrE family)